MRLGDLLGQGHFYGGSGLSGFDSTGLRHSKATLAGGESGGQNTRYALVRDGDRIGEVDLDNHYVKTAGKTRGTGGFEFTGQSSLGHKLVQHLGVNKPVVPKGAIAAKILLGRR